MNANKRASVVGGRAGLMANTAYIASQVLWERLGPPVRLSSECVVPPSAEAITPEWLTAVLCRGVEGAEVTDVRVIGGENGTSTRRDVVVSYNEIGANACLPTRLFTKSTATVASRLLLGLSGIVAGEAMFYNTLRPLLSLRSPRSFYAGYDAKACRSLLLLENLKGRRWSFPDPMSNQVTRADAEDVIGEIASYHATMWEGSCHTAYLRALRPALAWQQKLNSTVPFAKRTRIGLDRAKDAVPAGLYDRRLQLFPAFMRSLALHENSPHTLLHQDPHLGNWLRDDQGRMGLYDWQCVGRGHWALDYSYALASTLDTADRREWQEDLLKLYLQLLAEDGVASRPTFDEAWLGYRQQALHALVFAFFTLGGSRFGRELQPRNYTVAAIGRIAQHVVDLDSISLLS